MRRSEKLFGKIINSDETKILVTEACTIPIPAFLYPGRKTENTHLLQHDPFQPCTQPKCTKTQTHTHTHARISQHLCHFLSGTSSKLSFLPAAESFPMHVQMQRAQVNVCLNTFTLFNKPRFLIQKLSYVKTAH